MANTCLCPEYNPKKLWVSYLLALPPHGIFGAHNYYLGRRRMGIIFTCTVGILTFGWIIDLARMHCLVKRANDHIRANKNDPLCVDDAYLTWFPLGLIGLHRFYLGDWIIGIVFVITLSAFTFGFWFDACFMKLLVNASQSERQRTAARANGQTNPSYEEDDHSPPAYSSIFGMVAHTLSNLSRSSSSPDGEGTTTEEERTSNTDILPDYETVLARNVLEGKLPDDLPPEYSLSEQQNGIDQSQQFSDIYNLSTNSFDNQNRTVQSHTTPRYTIPPPAYDSIYHNDVVTHM